MCDKVALTYKQARQIINDAKKANHNHHKKKIPMREYFCDECTAWHVTSQKTKWGEE